ncbi:HAD family hydrolase [Candidatus Kaiserbacteria bacterium]|nr:HAD family hydrolase [Candidatus Kaiserbacteria bacterium]
MKNDYSHIKVIGFDLDQTLYPKSPDIDEAIQVYIYKKIATHKNVTVGESKKLFSDLYREGNGLSGRKTLIELEIPDASEIIQEALENADIASILEPDESVSVLLKKLKEQYKNIDIITGSNNDQTKKKLKALSISENIFNHIIVDEDASKSDGEAYRLWISRYGEFNSSEFLYIGDREGPDHEVPSSLGIKTILVNVQKVNPDIDIPQLKSIQSIDSFLL